MELLTFGIPMGDHDVVRRLAAGDPDLTGFFLHPMAGRRRIVCPPALTPLLKRFDSSYIGLWRHPLVPERSHSYVEYVWETGLAREIATSASQLVAWLFVELLGGVDDPGSDPHWDELVQVASVLGIADLSELFDLTMDGFPALYGLPSFAPRPPRDADVTPLSGYRGEFPGERDDPSSVRRTAGCEYGGGPGATAAPWLGSASPAGVFGDLIEAGDVAGAWLAVNTPGWRVDEVQRALSVLSATVDDARVGLLVRDWSEHTDPISGGY